MIVNKNTDYSRDLIEFNDTNYFLKNINFSKKNINYGFIVFKLIFENKEDYTDLIGTVSDNETLIQTVDLSEGLDRSFAARADLYDIPEAVKSGEISLDDLLAETGFDLKLTEEDRFQKLRQFRRLVNLEIEI